MIVRNSPRAMYSLDRLRRYIALALGANGALAQLLRQRASAADQLLT
jgi:hypothetical protein